MPTTLSISWVQWALGVLALAFLNSLGQHYGNKMVKVLEKKSMHYRYGFWRNTQRVLAFIGKGARVKEWKQEITDTTP